MHTTFICSSSLFAPGRPRGLQQAVVAAAGRGGMEAMAGGNNI